MQPKEIHQIDAVGRVLDELVPILRRRQDIIRNSRTELLRKAGDDLPWKRVIQAEALGNLDGLDFALDQINLVRAAAINQLRQAGKA